MSIVIVALTENYAVVASDSKIVGDKQSEKIHKMHIIRDDLVIFGAGNAGVVHGFLTEYRDNNDEYVYSSFENVCYSIETYEQFLRNVYGHVDIKGMIGVCDGEKFSIRLVESKKTDNFEIKVQSSENHIKFRILFPPDVEESVCNDLFRQNIQCIHQPLSLHGLVHACVQTIRMISHISASVGQPVDYWAYDRKANLCEKCLFDN